MTPTHRAYRHEAYDHDALPSTELEMGLLRDEAGTPTGLGLRWHYRIGEGAEPAIYYVAEDLHPMPDIRSVTAGAIIALVNDSCAAFNELLEDWFDLIGLPFQPAEYQLQDEAIHNVWRRAGRAPGEERD